MKIKDLHIGKEKLVVICGPCVIESEEHALNAAATLKQIFEELEIPLIFKSSYDKANRSSIDSFRGPGLEKGLSIFPISPMMVFATFVPCSGCFFKIIVLFRAITTIISFFPKIFCEHPYTIGNYWRVTF